MKRGRDPIPSYFPLDLAERLIDAYDLNGDGGIDLEELMEWLSKGLNMSKEEREAFSSRGGFCTSSATFVEEIATACQWVPEDAPEYMSEQNLWDELEDEVSTAHQIKEKRLQIKKDFEEAKNVISSFDMLGIDSRTLSMSKEEQELERLRISKLPTFCSGSFGEGSLGIQFNQDGTVERIAKDSPGEKIGVSRGDYLCQVGVGGQALSTRGMTFDEMKKTLLMFPRPVELKFEQHQRWERNQNGSGLPMINYKKLDSIFDKYDPHKVGSFGVNELSALWNRVHNMSCKQRGLFVVEAGAEGADVETQFDSYKWSAKLIEAHDKNQSGRLDKQELIDWISSEVELSAEERLSRVERGGYCISNNQFVEDVAFGLAVHIRKGPMSQSYSMKRVNNADDVDDADAEATQEGEKISAAEEVAAVAAAAAADSNNWMEENEHLEEQDVDDDGNDVSHAGEILQATFVAGPLGIKFNHQNEIELIQRHSQACRIRGLAKNDWLVSINAIDVRLKTFQEVNSMIQTVDRPMQVEFERHGNWHRDSATGLPALNVDKLRLIFGKHQCNDDHQGLECKEFANLMLEIHDLAMGKQGRMPKDDALFASYVLAQR